MSTTNVTASNSLDVVKWILAIGLLSIGIVGFYYFSEESLLLRVVILLAITAVSAFIATKTAKGQNSVEFLKAAHLEVRKVVWPSRQETIQTTGIVILMVILVAIFIWLLDSLLMWLVRFLTGQ